MASKAAASAPFEWANPAALVHALAGGVVGGVQSGVGLLLGALDEWFGARPRSV